MLLTVIVSKFDGISVDIFEVDGPAFPFGAGEKLRWVRVVDTEFREAVEEVVEGAFGEIEAHVRVLTETIHWDGRRRTLHKVDDGDVVQSHRWKRPTPIFVSGKVYRL